MSTAEDEHRKGGHVGVAATVARTRSRFWITNLQRMVKSIWYNVSHVSKDYSTDSFLQVMRRFASIRGWPERVYSDRGTQLVAALKELREAIKKLD